MEASKSDTLKAAVAVVYADLKSRTINPRGKFDGAGRWYAAHAELVAHVRAPSRAWPLSQMAAARTKKYVTGVAAAMGCTTEIELRAVI